MTQSQKPLYEALIKHIKQKPISFHVPGHKYGEINLSPFYQPILQLDATELTGLDDLHSPEEAILEAENLLADIFQVEKSYFLVNGSTVGNLAMIMAACTEDDTVLVQRNCHKSVLNALKLAKVNPIFLEPEYNREWKVADGITPETAAKAVNLYPNAKAIILTYPNYYGLATDVQEIIEQAHRHQIPVLVDEAHGAHFITGQPFPASAAQMGADIVVQSAHKTLPAMTMGSYLHFNSKLIEKTKVKEYLEMFQSSSPSYPIMASLDLARHYLAGYEQKDKTFLLKEINRFKEELAKIPQINVLEFPNHHGDCLKITLQSQCGLSGFQIQEKLEEQAIYTELADPYNVLLILPLLKQGQTYPLEETALKIKTILEDLPYQECKEDYQPAAGRISGLAIPYKEMSSLKEQDMHINNAVGHVCAETIIPYPPGIPLLLKGEKITEERLTQLKTLLESGARFQGDTNLRKESIRVFIQH
ncbi:aminotransferase class V-fold PLP-dependent enzyme [Paenibacillus sp. BSR1-1]|uniref:aminotransferase class I/II-fold pyridoxal phosphate-dependent enzyme n=1 Tax=Paenibacillus sp. BSR1-1 TaxID=3020845 RepID=UPI0025B14E29|nr:aminotransferase class V-fold PLP-dependent enzyme [Paenibacillus sp. BSR1-1]MDN3020013.1 aminotransferase class V-fold PLP-dependent enzyme [Paenibacillus sp. BSR1-1]